MSELTRMAYGLLFPVILDIDLTDETVDFLRKGGKSLLLGETAEEYTSGKLSAARMENESMANLKAFTQKAREYAEGLLIAGDADIAAVNRFEGITPLLPSRTAAQTMSIEELEKCVFEVSKKIVEAGINLVLSPTADIVTGANQWLANRTLSDDPEISARLVKGYVRGAKRAGLMTALKHFPGHPTCSGSPATETATVDCSLEIIKSLWQPFEAGIAEGVEGVMLSPALYPDIIGETPAPLSPFFPWTLRNRFEFSGLIITCDLDHKATQGTSNIEDVCVSALIAGADLLLLSPRSFNKLDTIARSIVQAVESGTLRYERFAEAAAKISAVTDHC
ncbi:glycoside hydrolase family 3 N-terminal domain-containing protein [Pseudomonas fulva]|uniref:glycoside hydrolase family 3 N-terminal domain-containing protein n=1 Tax=Pseudomonas fulva TaxID=47880 RepID=UPI0018AAE241|nr:glycoside hydrolase family 3 N-terminal domain-containing protein [Pseudomonas fulva]MBF8774059.1 glycoside hydrolase [Pseudomonas fulva]